MPHRKHVASPLRSQLLFRETVLIYSENHTKCINTLCRQNVEFLNIEVGGMYSNHFALNI
jgi:hypothetical protein